MAERTSIAERLRRLGVSPSVRTAPRRCEHAVPGTEVITRAEGAFLLREVDFPAGHVHGSLPLPHPAGARLGEVGTWDPDDRLTDLDPAGCLFLDTETTGLAGGTGTYAFLVGTLSFRSDRWRLRQYLMPDFASERPMLAAVLEEVAESGCLVTFNGKTFDIPLLDARRVLARCEGGAIDERPHLDMLHPSRRLWRRVHADCSLTTLEREVLGFRRPADIPSHEIPQRFFRFLREGDGGLLEEVLVHNEWDLLSLLGLAEEVGRLLAGTSAAAHAAVEVGLGRWMEARGAGDAAARRYEAALAGNAGGAERSEALRRLSLRHKRAGRWDEAARCWEDLAAGGGRAGLWAREEQAKYLEHRCRDYAAAMVRVRDVLRGVWRLDPEDRAAWRKRRERLQRKHRARGRERPQGKRG